MRIKTFTLFTLALLLSAVSFAQKSNHARVLNTTQSTLVTDLTRTQMRSQVLPDATFAQKAKSSQTTAKNTVNRIAAVSLPSGVESTYYILKGTSSRGGETETLAKVAYDGDDVYISGLSYFLPDAFVKGTFTDDNTVVFSAGQSFGIYSFSDVDAEIIFGAYSADGPVDVTATYNPEEDTFTFPALTAEYYVLPDDGTTGLTAYWKTAVTISPVDEDTALPVEAPSDLVAEDWAYSGLDYWHDTEVSKVVKVGFYGDDVYIQGLCDYLPEAWVKGTKSGNTITFPGYQYYGKYSSYDLYIRGLNGESFGDGDVVFTYDEAAEKLTTEYAIFLYGETSTSGGNFAAETNVVISKIKEAPGVPANPSFGNMQFNPKGDKIEVNISVVDTEGNGMLVSKLYYKLYIKDETNTNVPLTFSKELYTSLDADIEEIPVVTDDTDFANGVVALKMDHSTWETIGVQSIYKGGGESHESEIVWYTIKRPTTTTLPEGLSVTSNDFIGTEGSEKEDFSTTLNVAVDGDDLYIQGFGKDAGLSDSWVKGTKDTDGVYTFPSAQDLGATSSYRIFLIGYNDETGEVEDPQLKYDAASGNYVFLNCFVANARYTDRSYYYSHFHAGSTISGKGEVDEVVTPPANLVTEEYTFKGTDVFADEGADASVARTVKVGFSGNEVYVQGLSEVLPNAWVKGTVADNVITFRTGQQLGDYNAYTLYFVGYANGATTHYVCTYDATAGVITGPASVNLGINIYKDQISRSLFESYSGVTITKIVEKAATPAAPEIGNLHYTVYGNYIDFTINTVDTDGDGLLSDKLSYKLLYKDDLGTQHDVTLTTENYQNLTSDLTEIPYGYQDTEDGYDIYTDVIYLNMDISGWSQIGVQSIYKGGGESHESEIVWYDVTYPYTVEAPTSQTAAVYDFKGTRNNADYSGTLNVVADGNDLYIQGVVSATDELWIRGIKGADDVYTFPRGAYLGSYYDRYLLFLIGYDATTAAVDDLKIKYDSATETYTLVNNLVVNATYTDRIYGLYVYGAGSTLTKQTNGIESIKAADAAEGKIYSLTGQRLGADAKGLVIKNGKKIIVK